MPTKRATKSGPYTVRKSGPSHKSGPQIGKRATDYGKKKGR
jgi:hypothetical protein